MEWSKTPGFTQFQGKRILTMDYGTKVAGLAYFLPGSDPYPLQYGRIIPKDDQDLISKLKIIIDDEFIDIFVLGLPLFTYGTHSKMTEKVIKLSEIIKKLISPIPLYLQDETLSSFEAEDRMKNDPKFNFKVDPKKIDELAACIILEDFLKISH